MNDIDALAGFEPLRQAQHVTVSMTPFASISSNNQYISNNMQTKEALSKIDKLVIQYLALADNEDTAKQIVEASNDAKSAINDGQNCDDTLTSFKHTLDLIVDGIDESIDTRSAKAVEVAFKSMWNIDTLSTSQQETLKLACKEIDDHGVMSVATAKKLLLLINRQQSDNNTETMIAVVEDAYANPDDILVDESNIEHQLSYLGHVVDESVARLPECLAHLSASATGSSKTAQQIVNDLQSICKRQTSSSALIASQYVETLKQHLNDWTLAMRYGATHGVPNGKSVVQATLLAQSEAWQSFMTKLQELLKNIASTFSCAPSMDTAKSVTGSELLRVKLIQNWGQADDVTYHSIAHVLQSLDIDCQLKIVNASTLYLMIGLDRTSIVNHPPIVDAEHCKLKCLELIAKGLGSFAINANRIEELYNCYIKTHSPNWWNALVFCNKAFNISNASQTFEAYWTLLDNYEKLACLTLLGSTDSATFAKFVIGDIAWFDVPEQCRVEFSTAIASNIDA